MEKSPAGLTYSAEFAMKARLRAVETLLTVLIRELPDQAGFLKRVNELIDHEQMRFAAPVRELPEPSRTSAHEAVNAEMEAIRDAVRHMVMGQRPG
jgi:hypothetical protein